MFLYVSFVSGKRTNEQQWNQWNLTCGGAVAQILHCNSYLGEISHKMTAFLIVLCKYVEEERLHVVI